MAKISLEFAGFDSVMRKLNQLNADIQPIANEALTKTFDIITDKAKKAAVKPNYPAKGKYSTGDTAESLVTNPRIKWDKTVGSVQVGFDIKRGGLASIFMMYGTPRYMKVQELYDAFFSEQTKGEVLAAQKEIFYNALEKLQ